MSDPLELRYSHTVNAPRDLVFETWTRADHLDRWWGPRGFTTTTESMDVRVGGEWRFQMHHPVHGQFPNRIRYTEIVPSERLEYEHDAGVDNDPEGFHVTVTFTSVGGQTTVTMRTRLGSIEAVERAKSFGAEDGGNETLARMGEHLDAAAEGDLVLVRTIRAPRSLVWTSWTEAAHLQRWWGPAGLETRFVHLDLRPGGTCLFSMTGPPGSMMEGTSWGRFVYSEIVPEERIVWRHGFSDANGGSGRHPMAPEFPETLLLCATFTDCPEGTTLTLRGRPLGANDDELAMFAASMEGMHAGFGANFDLLDSQLSL